MKTENMDNFLDLVKKHGSTTPIWVVIDGSGTKSMCGVSPKETIKMCKETMKHSNLESYEINVDFEFREFEMILIHQIDA